MLRDGNVISVQGGRDNDIPLGGRLLGMGHNSRDQVGVVLDYEVEPPIPIHARLP